MFVTSRAQVVIDRRAFSFVERVENSGHLRDLDRAPSGGRPGFVIVTPARRIFFEHAGRVEL